MKMFPEFDGRWAYGWIITVEQHCEAKGVSEEKKFSEAEKALTRDALFWWYDWKRRNQRASWMDFVIALLRKFEPNSDPFLPDPVQHTGEEESQSDEARKAKATNLELRRNWCEEWVQFRSSEDERLEDDGISENKRSEAIPTEIVVTTLEEEAGAKRNEQQPPPKPPDLVLVAGVHTVGNLTKVTGRQDRSSAPARFTARANRRPPPKPPNWVSQAVAEEKQTDATLEEVASNAKKNCVLGIKTQERVKPEFQQHDITTVVDTRMVTKRPPPEPPDRDACIGRHKMEEMKLIFYKIHSAGTHVSSSLAIANMKKIQHSPKTFDTMVRSCLWQGKPSYSCTELHRLRWRHEQNWKHCQVIVICWENLKLQPHELGSIVKTSNQNFNADVGSKGSCVFSFVLTFTHWNPGGCSYFSATTWSTSFQQWDPGGRFYSPYSDSARKWITGRLLHITLGAATYIQEGFSTSILEDKDVLRGGVMIGTQLLGIGPILLESNEVRQ